MKIAKREKIFLMIVAAVMVIAMIPLSIFAAGGTDSSDEAVQEEENTEIISEEAQEEEDGGSGSDSLQEEETSEEETETDAEIREISTVEFSSDYVLISNAVREAGSVYIFSSGTEAVVETTKTGIRIYDNNGEYIGGDEETACVSITDDTVISGIEVYFHAEGEPEAAWHTVLLDENISIVFDSAAPEASLSFEECGRNGFYNDDLTVTAGINDELSGIASVRYVVTADGEITQYETLYSRADGTDDILENFSAEIIVDAAANDSDKVIVMVIAEDLAGNSETYTSDPVMIDVTAPGISVSYDNDAAENEKYFAKTRTAEILVTEKAGHLDIDDIVITITARDADGNALDDAYTLSDWTEEESENGDDSVYTLTVAYEKEAYYTFEISCTDKAGNACSGADYGDSAAPEEFVIDMTAPSGSVTLNETTWDNLLSAITFGHYSRTQVKVTAEAYDSLSPYYIEYYVYDESEFVFESDGSLHVFTAAELDAISFDEYEDYTTSSDSQFVVYLKITDHAGNYVYVNSDGYIIDSLSGVIEYEIVTEKNENNIYSADEVIINYTVNDEDENGSFSGICTVSWQVTSNGVETQSDSYDLSVVSPSYSELEKCFEGTIAVDSELNNSSDVVVMITAEDNAGNTSSVSIKLDIDITQPEISISYDNNDAVNDLYFVGERTATIVITERTSHFDPDNADITITAKDAAGKKIDVSDLITDLDWTTAEDSEDENAAQHTAQITFSEDANYTFSISFTDSAGLSNKTADTGTSEAPYKFTVDTTAPTGTVTATSESGSSLTWSKLRTSLTYGFWAKDRIRITYTADDETSPVYSVEYYKVSAGNASDNTTPLTKSQLDGINSWKILSTLTVETDEQFTVYLRITDYAGNFTYICTNGLIVDETIPEETLTPIVSAAAEQSESGIYSSDVDILINVTDPLNGGTYSGISRITYEILNMGEITQSGTLYSFSESSPSQSLLRQNWSGTITVDPDLNNSNDVKIIIYAEDNAGNSSCEALAVEIDITAPSISVSYDNNQTDSGIYFSADRTATIVITERNFDPDDVEIKITNSDGSIPEVTGWTEQAGSGNGDSTTWTAEVIYNADGDYTFDISFTDKAGNSAGTADYGASAAPQEFTIDKTAPVISISYDNNSVCNGTYFNDARVMTIIITEHNFDPERVYIEQSGELDGADLGEFNVSWSSDGDIHTGVINYSSDGDYTFDISVLDAAGNSNSDVDYGSSEAAQAFTVDTTRYTDTHRIISGVEDGCAYKDEVIPSVNFEDINYQQGSVEFKLTRVKYYLEEDVTDEFITGRYKETSAGVAASFDTFEKTTENDGIYTFTVSYTDLAGNDVSESVTFSVNRYGSVYVYSADLIALIADGGGYVRSVEGMDLTITEYNPDRLVEDSLNISVLLDGKALDVVTDMNISDDAQTGTSGWYQYEYAISTESFTSDGVYKITVSSEDAAGNNPESTNSDYNEIIFRLDTAAPEITSITGLEESIINAAEQTVEFTVYDTIGLESIQISVVDPEGEVMLSEVINEEDLAEDPNNYTGSVTLTESSLPQTLRIIATDKAGNIIDTGEEGFAESAAYAFNSSVTISSDFLVRLLADKALLRALLAGILAAAVLLISAIVFITRKKNTERDPEI